jgi:predicted DNA-binding transcriptional regulator AlpA
LSEETSNPPRRRWGDRRHVRQRYPVSNMSIWRWMNDPDIRFPKPIKLGSHKNAHCLWDLDELDAWDEQQKAAR